jgi:hypothetical protein
MTTIHKPSDIVIGKRYKNKFIEDNCPNVVFLGSGQQNRKAKYLVIIESEDNNIGQMAQSPSNCHPDYWKTGFTEIK